ncbi:MULTISPECIES: glucosyltransferase domain-containing protein [Variovorax]|uniref:Glycosyltransferase RgtA/B/C/D-like domain-containing protein n=1 Tax=Variovorax guangxiensis TaxID=1775474 RepID=A0A840FGP6_9BURK|nr:glucosyltransferase domain-containing protein [Variovorax guangxiensis]MBB4219335.1 hypothetical protein [Variovorax guangxiensis]
MNKRFFSIEENGDGHNFRLILIVLAAAFLSKGVVLFRGFSIDDYAFANGVGEKEVSLFFSQGRYLMALIFWVLESLGVNSSDLYFPLGILVLILQSTFVVSIFRFVGVERLPAAGLVGALVVAHPYLTEIITFRLVLASYCVALIFSILALEALIRWPSTWKGWAVALVATLGMVFTYQVFLNYFAVAIVFALLLSLISNQDDGHTVSISRSASRRAVDLIIVGVVAGIIFLATTGLARYYGVNGDVDRAKIIALTDVPERVGQVYSSLANIYWLNEPVYSGWLKILVAAIVVYSILTILWKVFLTRKNGKSWLFSISILILLAPVSIGLIVAFKSWWPVPRVVAHVSVLCGLILLTADFCFQNPGRKGLRTLSGVARCIILVGFVFLSNQILVDQQRLNDWDRLMANRIVSRLEMIPNFGEVKYVSISGGSWAFPEKLRTIQGDLNVSSFFPEHSKVSLLSEISGYKFEHADARGAAKGAEYCRDRRPWPHAESLAVFGDLAIVCLKKIS